MGKQKSYILVGSVFIGFIVLMLLFTIISNNVKKTKVSFDADIYYVEVGKTRALTPTIYAGGKVVENIVFTYESSDSSIANLKPGSYSVDTASVECWAFFQLTEDGNFAVDDKGNYILKKSKIPYNEGDSIQVLGDPSTGNYYFYINGVRSRAASNRIYNEDEIKAIATRYEDDVICFYLNGYPTKIPYNEYIIPVRNEQTGTWFIDGEDTKVSYNSIPTTIEGLKVGSATITATGSIDGETFVLTTTIKVCEPDPKGIEINYIDDTIIVNLNQEFGVNYKVYANNEFADPLQDVTYSCTSGISNKDGKFTANKTGNQKITIYVDEEKAFQISTPTAIISKVVKVIVLDTTDEQVELIEAARLAIENIGKVDDSAECLARYMAAKEAISKVNKENSSAITNLNTFKSAQNKLENE